MSVSRKDEEEQRSTRRAQLADRVRMTLEEAAAIARACAIADAIQDDIEASMRLHGPLFSLDPVVVEVTSDSRTLKTLNRNPPQRDRYKLQMA